jgi:hypothetical protein
MKNNSLILCLLGVLFFTSVNGQNEKFKALFIYNFTNYIDWPYYGGSSFIIAVIGDSPIISELEAISKIKSVGKLSIEVKKISSASEIGNASIVYVPGAKKRILPELSQACAGKAVLIISDEAGGNFGINFTEINQKQSFQISKSNIEAHHLKVNSNLIALGTSVN